MNADGKPTLIKEPKVESIAAKCPPFFISVQRWMFVYVFSASERGGTIILVLDEAIAVDIIPPLPQACFLNNKIE